MPISLTGTGVIVLFLEMLLNVFGITPDPGSVDAVVNGAVIVIGWILLLVGQLRRKDLHFGIVRK